MEMFTKCYRCYETNKELYVRDGKQTKVCVECYEAHYLPICKTNSELKQTLKEADRRAKKRRQQIVLEYLSDKSCLDCGESDMIVLEFDHRDPKEKTKSVCEILSSGTVKQLTKEIGKCDVVCANCHRKRTAQMFGSWRLSF